MDLPKTKATSLEPAKGLASPYDDDHLPLLTPSEVKALGIYPDQVGGMKLDGEETIQIGARVPKAVMYLIDRLVERKVMRVGSRSEFVRLAIVNAAFAFASEIQEGRLKLTVKRLEMLRRLQAEAVQLHDIGEAAALARKNATTLLADGSRWQAIQTLRVAKRFMEDIPFGGLRAEFGGKLLGNIDPGGDVDAVGEIWRRVASGELDRDDEEEVGEGVKIG